MIGVKMLSTSLALIMAISLLALNIGPAVASEQTVVRVAETELVRTNIAPPGATGDAELSFIIDSSRRLRDLELEVKAEGLVPGANHFLFLGNRFIAFQRADILGRIKIERELEDFPLVILRRLPVIITDEFARVLLFGEFREFEEDEFEKD